MLQQILAVFLVLGLLAVSLAMLKKRGIAKFNVSLPRRTTGSRQMEVVDRITLTAHHSLHLVRVRDRVILIGVSPSGCNTVESFASPQPPPALEFQS
jgi:flagellar biogenesis protein FliO